MAVRSYGVNDPETAKLWAKELFRETIRKTYFYAFVGTGTDNLVQEKTETSKSAGDRITVTLMRLLQQAGIQGSGQVEGNEEALETFTDNIFVDALDFAVRVKNKGTIDQQRVPFNLRENARDLLSDHWAERMDIGLFNQLAGNTAQTDMRYTGLQAATAPSAGRHLWASGSDDESLTSSHKFTLAFLDKAIARAEVRGTDGAPRIRPVRIKSYKRGAGYYKGVKYVAFLHNWQVHDLRSDAATAGNWYDIQQAAIMGGDLTENPIFTGGDVVGVHNGTLIMKCESIPMGVNSSTGAVVTDVRRAVLCGAQAAIVAYGMDFGGGRMQWQEELFNYAKELGVDSHLIHGIKKARFNTQDFAVMVMSSHAAMP